MRSLNHQTASYREHRNISIGISTLYICTIYLYTSVYADKCECEIESEREMSVYLLWCTYITRDECVRRYNGAPGTEKAIVTRLRRCVAKAALRRFAGWFIRVALRYCISAQPDKPSASPRFLPLHNYSEGRGNGKYRLSARERMKTRKDQTDSPTHYIKVDVCINIYVYLQCKCILYICGVHSLRDESSWWIMCLNSRTNYTKFFFTNFLFFFFHLCIYSTIFFIYTLYVYSNFLFRSCFSLWLTTIAYMYLKRKKNSYMK